MPGFITDLMAFYDETSSLLRYIVKVGDLIRDWDGDLGVITGFDNNNDVIVYFTTYCDVVVNESILIDKESVEEIVYEGR
jgi:uncharacterized protein YkvS